MNPMQVHAAYTGLPSTITNSEVLTSGYQNAIHQAGDEDREQDLLSYMKQLSEIFVEQNLTCNDDDLESFSDALVTLTTLGKPDVAGKLLTALKSFGRLNQSSSLMPATLLKNISSVSDILASNVVDMKKVLTDMKLVIPRKMVKAARKAATISKPKEHISADTVDETEDPLQHQDITMETDTQDTASDAIRDLNSTLNIRNRGILREHYASEEFSELPEDKRMSYMRYYTDSVLAIDKKALSNPHIINMISDLVDKDTVLRILEKARARDLTTDDIEMAIEEFCDAVNSAKGCYGMFSATPVLVNGSMMVAIKDYDWVKGKATL